MLIYQDGVLVTKTISLPTNQPPAQPLWRSKVTLYAGMSDFELDALDAFLQGVATTRQRMVWTDALEIDCGDPQVVALATTLFGAARAVELLR